MHDHFIAQGRAGGYILKNEIVPPRRTLRYIADYAGQGGYYGKWSQYHGRFFSSRKVQL